MANKRILIIKHGALGDIVLASGAMKAIREHHSDAHLTLLTTRPYAGLLATSGWFDTIWIDTRPKLWQLNELLHLRKQLRDGAFDRVYDVQTSQRSSQYLTLFGNNKPEWVGIAQRASHCHDTPERTQLHTLDRLEQQLSLANIMMQSPDVSWLHGNGNIHGLKPPYVLLVPGGSAHRPDKRYPETHYVVVANHLAAQHIQPVLIGSQAEAALLENIERNAPDCLNLCNTTSIADVADLARHATCAIGNDTGPMHVIAATGCPSVVLFSAASNPALCAPRGEHVCVIQRDILGDVTPAEVLHAAQTVALQGVIETAN